MDTTELMNEAASLPLEARVGLVDSLLQPLNPVDESVAHEWVVRARQRLNDLVAGRVEGISGDEVFEKARRRFIFVLYGAKEIDNGHNDFRSLCSFSCSRG